MTTFEIASLALGIAQIGIVYYGIRTMQTMGDNRAAEADKKHKQVIDSLETRDRADARRHAETMQANAERHDEAVGAEKLRHTEAMTALQELIRRTAGPQTA